nr:hypothetical protein TetV2_00627 [Oceanusvirus sp.]
MLRLTKKRSGKSPSEQREMWALEASKAKITVGGFRFGKADAAKLKVVSMNVYYGQVSGPDGTLSHPPIDVREYAALFETGADVVAIQEAVLSALPKGSPIANTAKSYAARDAPGSDHWARWTKRFPEGLFKTWWAGLKAVAKARGFLPLPPDGCGDAGSMYGQRFGNAVFVHAKRVQALGLPAPSAACVPRLLGRSEIKRYAGETEDRSALAVHFGDRLTLINTHLSEKATFSSKTGRSTQRDMMASALKLRKKGRRTVVVGDFNKSDPTTVPPQVEPFYTVAYDADKDRDLYDLLRESGFACLPNDRATAWNARHPDQVCSDFMTAKELRKGVKILMPWSGTKVISDHAALAFSVPV